MGRVGWECRALFSFLHLLSSINLGNVGQEVEDTAGVAPLVVVPRDQLDEVLVEGDTGLGIEDGGVGVAVEVRGDDVVLGVSQNTWKELAMNRHGESEGY